ncbi:MAG: AAA family ATPase [Myxococcota bacterium]
MRIEALSLEAFGPFSGRTLDLVGEDDTPLCVVYGPNEAGKSSALRAIRGLLYGIEHDSRDNFVHAHVDLRIGARLRFADGLVAQVTRRKGRKQTLTGEGQQGEEGVRRVEGLAEAIPENLFRHFYGLDHPGLVEGSQQLLEDGGELSRALFGAGLGIVHLRKVIEGLESEAEAIFVPRGQKQRVAVALADWKATQAEIRSAALEPSRFEAQARQVDQLAERLAALEGELAELQTALSRSRRLKEARLARAQAEQEREQVRARIARESERATALELAPQLVEAREPIEALHQRLGAYREARDQLPRRAQARAEVGEQIAALEEQLGSALGTASTADLRRILARVDPVRARVAEVGRAADRVDQAAEADAEARAELESLVHESGGSSADLGEDVDVRDGDADALASALARARPLGAIDEEVAALRDDLEAVERSLLPRRERLGLARLGRDAIEGLAVPPQTLIEAHARRFDELARELERRREAAEARALQRLALGAELERLQAGGPLPSEDELRAVRAERDAFWQRLRAGVVDGGPIGSRAAGSAIGPDRPEPVGSASAALDPVGLGELAARFEGRIETADRLADRLRREAERVARGAELTIQLRQLDEEIAAAARACERIEAEQSGLEVEWRALWPAAIGEPGSPASRLDWSAELAALVGVFGEQRDRADRLARRLEVRRIAVEGLAAALGDRIGVGGDLGGGVGGGFGGGFREGEEREAAVEALASLGPWLERAEREQARRAEERQRRREAKRLRAQALRQVERSDRDRRQAEAQHARAQADWAREREAVGLPSTIRLEEVAPCLDRVTALLERRREAEELGRRVDQIRAQVRGFEAEATRLVRRCLPAIWDFAPDVAALRLKRELERAQEQATRAEAVRAALVEARDDLAEVERRLGARDETLRTLSAAAEGSDAPDLDRLVAAIAQLEARVQDRQEARLALAKSLSVERAQLQAMDGNARIAELAEQAESRLAAVRKDVVRYAELRLARRILEQEVESFRRENQGPLLGCASGLFAALTGGAYPRVLSDAGEDGRVRLVAVNRTGRELAVEALSSGTRDQLFLALRLAALMTAQGRAESMPLVADDILIEFDDERTRATLGVLADVSRSTQVLLFSHHRHVADLAGDLGEAVRIVTL